ncbi:MAG: Holo-[acyl-carrier-protein] synthase [Chlamydiae bacterium]|nr:Holo-[acyl-carrier-protein] synthase [Chlamydiota bacterium]
MIKGVGTDIIEIGRFKALMDRHPKRFLQRLFTEKERNYCSKFKDSERHFTGRFSAKEAVAKALGCGFGASLSYQDISIENNELGKPIVTFSEEAKKRFDQPKIEVSLSHCQEFATATAIWF